MSFGALETGFKFNDFDSHPGAKAPEFLTIIGQSFAKLIESGWIVSMLSRQWPRRRYYHFYAHLLRGLFFSLVILETCHRESDAHEEVARSWEAVSVEVSNPPDLPLGAPGLTCFFHSTQT